MGRRSIAPEKLLRALLLQVFYTVRSERLLMERIELQSVVPLVVGLSMDDPVWDASTFSKNPGSLAQKEGGEEVFPGSVEAGTGKESAQ